MKKVKIIRNGSTQTYGNGGNAIAIQPIVPTPEPLKDNFGEAF